jgi:hypothetical protein
MTQDLLDALNSGKRISVEDGESLYTLYMTRAATPMVRVSLATSSDTASITLRKLNNLPQEILIKLLERMCGYL